MFLLKGEKFMLEIHLKQPGFTYNYYVPITKNKWKIEKIMKAGNKNSICRMILIKLVFYMIWLMVNIKIWLKEHNL